MLYDVYLDGTAEYVGQTQDRSEILWKEREMREILYRGRPTDIIIISTHQLSDRVTTVVAKVVANESNRPRPQAPVYPRLHTAGR